MNYKRKEKPKKTVKRDLDFQEHDSNRLIEMAWQDRTPFDAIYAQFGLTENQVKNTMRTLISKQAYKRWRKRVQHRKTKHKKNFREKNMRFEGPW